MSYRKQMTRVACALAGAFALAAGPAFAQGKVKVGFMLPYTGTYAALGNAITNGFKLAVAENGGKLGGRDIEYFTVDDESDPVHDTAPVQRRTTAAKRIWSDRVCPATNAGCRIIDEANMTSSVSREGEIDLR